MRHRPHGAPERHVSSALLLLAWLYPLAAAPGTVAAEDDGPSGRRTVVLELFTSQGCSSCPRADRLLAKLGRDGSLAGARLIPLSFHVDYWNHIGWTDPFSSAEWSDRQRAYARSFKLRSIYTPQLVVNGVSELVGSDAREVERRVDAAAALSGQARLDLTLAGSREDGTLDIQLHARLERRTAGGRDLDAVIVLFENGLVTEVGRGENAHRTLENEFVVRHLETVFTLSATAGAEREGALAVRIEDDWRPVNLGVAAFLQDPETLRIYGADSILLRDAL